MKSIYLKHIAFVNWNKKIYCMYILKGLKQNEIDACKTSQSFCYRFVFASIFLCFYLLVIFKRGIRVLRLFSKTFQVENIGHRR